MATKSDNWLVFIDTNIMLDFYRLGGERADRQIASLQRHLESIIVTEQVQMEFLKNRQKVIVDSIGNLKAPPSNAQLPAIVSSTMTASALAKRLKEASNAHRKIQEKVERILREPAKYDTVFKGLRRLFSYNSAYNLRRPNTLRYSIRNKARKRFVLGYPPRKSGDTSIGDALNWEWIIHCALSCPNNSNIMIVSRDGDYGAAYRGVSILNDWLREEFKKRVSQKRKIELTNRLTDALRLLDETVTIEDEKAEDDLLKNYQTYLDWVNRPEVDGDSKQFAEFLKNMGLGPAQDKD